MTNEDLYTYCEDNSTPEGPVLKEITRDTYAHQLKPRMLSGHLQGSLLTMISMLINPHYILEIGTFTGYSAICLSAGLKPNGKLISIEANEELIPVIKKNIEKAQKTDKIELILGSALDVIPTLNMPFDLVFIDADKLNYQNYFDLVLEKTAMGGLIISDNVLWDQKVIDSSKVDKTTASLRKYNQYLANHPNVETVLLPIRDGLSLARKIK